MKIQSNLFIVIVFTNFVSVVDFWSFVARLVRAGLQRVRELNEPGMVALYLGKCRQNADFLVIALEFSVQVSTAHEIFWKVCLFHAKVANILPRLWVKHELSLEEKERLYDQFHQVCHYFLQFQGKIADPLNLQTGPKTYRRMIFACIDSVNCN